MELLLRARRDLRFSAEQIGIAQQLSGVEQCDATRGR
jgi:hypothetical protein